MNWPERFFEPSTAFDVPMVGWTLGVLVGALAIASVLVRVLHRQRKLSDATFRELLARIRTWWILIPVLVGPILLGSAPVVVLFTVLGIACFREYARATGLFRELVLVATVTLGILGLGFAALDNWYGFFVALTPLVTALIAVVALVGDRPQGFVQRVALAGFGFALFGTALGHLSFLANDQIYRNVLLWMLVCVEANDIFAYLCGRLFGRRHFAPNTSPNKTLGGALGALVLTTALAMALGTLAFEGTEVDTWPHLLTLGLLIGILGQCGDLVLSSIKRDLGIKDMASTLPGHGGLLDRFDSLLLVAPAVFHYVGYVLPEGIGLDLPVRVLSGGGG
tara:strand:+ start:3121 stop:4131 length:1011 start_codon:yes stop_codon:yes gene_type:complete